MALADRPRLARLVEAAEQWTGVAVRSAQQVERWQVAEQEYMDLWQEAEELALFSMDYVNGRPGELLNERRRMIAQRSRVALKFDPLAGAEAQLLADFAFGKGVPKPTARDPKVQEVVDEAWTDANNEEKLTGFAAQRRLSNELMTTGEIFTTLYVGGGKVRVGRLDPDTVEAVVPDPEDRLRPLWYMVRQRRFKWDFQADRADVSDTVAGPEGRMKVRYYKHWRNYDDAVAEREMGLVDDGEEPLQTPPPDKLAKGVVYHTAINQTGEELRGNPPWARSLRFFAAMTTLTESHVVMAQAASSFIAQRVSQGTPRQIQRAAANILGHTSELGSARLAGSGVGPEMPAFAPGGQTPPAPGSWWNSNPESRLEALNLNSGAGQMAQSAQIVRAPIAAAAGFGQHYLGDASDANLATASTLELPATMRVQSWQEYFESMLRWFTDRAIEAAVKSGRLGGLDGFPEEGPISEMRLHEAEDRAAMERRTGKDLTYEFVMPFPGRRQLGDVVTAVQLVAMSMDPNGVNVALRRHLLRFFFEQIGIDDIGHAVAECVPENGVPGGIGPAAQTGSWHTPAQFLPDGKGGMLAAPTPAQTPEPGSPGDGDRTARARTQSTPPGETPAAEEWIPAEARQVVTAFEEATGARFDQLVLNPALAATLELAAAGSNGSG